MSRHTAQFCRKLTWEPSDKPGHIQQRETKTNKWRKTVNERNRKPSEAENLIERLIGVLTSTDYDILGESWRITWEYPGFICITSTDHQGDNYVAAGFDAEGHMLFETLKDGECVYADEHPVCWDSEIDDLVTIWRENVVLALRPLDLSGPQGETG